MANGQWETRYAEADIPWDSGTPSVELLKILDEQRIVPGSAIEIGCGTGTNAVALAQRGFRVTAIDVSPTAIARARARAAQEAPGLDLSFVEADLLAAPPALPPADLLFDRGVYHVLRREDLDACLRMLTALTRPGSWYVVLSGSADDPASSDLPGPPRIRARDLVGELESLFELRSLRPFHWTEVGRGEARRQPLGWSAAWVRRG